MKGFSSRFMKRDKQVSLKPQPPREISEITKEYSEQLGKAAQAGYQVYVYQKELARLNDRLEQLNLEAASRNKLDLDTKKNEVADEQTK